MHELLNDVDRLKFSLVSLLIIFYQRNLWVRYSFRLAFREQGAKLEKKGIWLPVTKFPGHFRATNPPASTANLYYIKSSPL